MKCPVCTIELRITDRQGVEIDYCPQCRGVWLDRGELDKIIERSATPPAPPARTQEANYEERGKRKNEEYFDDDMEFGRQTRDDDDSYDKRTGKKRKSFLSELFDFD